MATRAFAAESRFELVHQIALFGGEIDRGFHHHLAVQVAGRAAAHGLDALVAQAEDLAGLGLGGNADFGLPFFPLIRLAVPAYEENALPPDLAQIPTEKPGSRKAA